MSFTITVKENWPVVNVLNFLIKFQKELAAASEILSVHDVYMLEMCKTMLDQMEYFSYFENVVIFSTFISIKSSVNNLSFNKQERQKMICDMDTLIELYKKCPNYWTVKEFIFHQNKKNYQKQLQDQISQIEKKVSDFNTKEKEKLEIQKKKQYSLDKDYIKNNKYYYERCKFYISNGYDGYKNDDDFPLDNDEEYDPVEMKKTIIEAHKKKNYDLASQHASPARIYQERKFVNWENDISLDSENFIFEDK